MSENEREREREKLWFVAHRSTEGDQWVHLAKLCVCAGACVRVCIDSHSTLQGTQILSNLSSYREHLKCVCVRGRVYVNLNSVESILHVVFQPCTNAIAIFQPMIPCMWLQYPVLYAFYVRMICSVGHVGKIQTLTVWPFRWRRKKRGKNGRIYRWLACILKFNRCSRRHTVIAMYRMYKYVCSFLIRVCSSESARIESLDEVNIMYSSKKKFVKKRKDRVYTLA